MRIIKPDFDDINVYRIIAGEMLNLETSTLHYINGKPLTVGEDITVQNYRGYPKITDGAVQYTIKSAAGYIILPSGYDIKGFEENIIQAIKMLEAAMVNSDGLRVQVLKNYHTVDASFNTNIKVKCALNLTKNSIPPTVARWNAPVVKENVKRQFNTLDTDIRRGRFTWFIQTIDKFDFNISSENVDDAISRFACSVFYDADNICNFNHNDTTHELNINNFKGSSNIIEENITLFKHGNPLIFELSEFWKEHVPNTNAGKFLRNIPDNKIFEHDYHAIEFKPVKCAENSNETSTEICSKCRSVLYGDNYAMVGSVKNPQSVQCVALCPLCLHSSPAEKPIEMKYLLIFRVTFPRSIDDMINGEDITPQRRDLRAEAMKRVQRKTLHTNGLDVKCILIGDKYLAFDDIADYLFTKLSVIDDFAGRKVCTAKLVE